MVPPSAASYMRGMATGALLVAMMFGPEWIAQHIQPVKAKGRHGSSVHLENLGIIYQLSSMFAQAAIGPSRQLFALFWLTCRLILMLSFVDFCKEPLGALILALTPDTLRVGNGRRLLHHSALGFVITAGIIMGALLVLVPARSFAADVDGSTTSCARTFSRACTASKASSGRMMVGPTTPARTVPSVEGVLAGLTEALLRFRFGDDSVAVTVQHVDPLQRLLVQLILGVALVPMSLLGDVLARRRTLLPGGRVYRALTAAPDVVIALFAILPTSRLLELAWEIRFSAGVPSQATQQICAQELSALSDLLFYRCVLRGAVLLLRATLYRPDPVHTGLRLLSDEWHRSVPSPVASLAVQISGVARLLACTPPTWAFWESTALAVALSHTDTWVLVLMPSSMIGVRLLVDGCSALTSRNSRHLRRTYALIQLAIELLTIQMCAYPLFLRTMSPLFFLFGFRSSGQLWMSSNLTVPTVPPRSAVLQFFPSVLAAAARWDELFDDAFEANEQPAGVAFDPRVASTQHVNPRLSDVMEADEELSSVPQRPPLSAPAFLHSRRLDYPTSQTVERWDDVVKGSNAWLRGVVGHLRGASSVGLDDDEQLELSMSTGDSDGRRWPALQQRRTFADLFASKGTRRGSILDGLMSGRRRSVASERRRTMFGGGEPPDPSHISFEECLRKRLTSVLPKELRDSAARVLRALEVVNGPQAARFRDYTLQVIGELLSADLSRKLLTSSGRNQFRLGLLELLKQQESAGGADSVPEAFRLNREVISALADWLDDPAIGVGGVLRPPPSVVPPSSINPPQGSEHDVSYGADTFAVLLGSAVTESSKLNVYLDLPGAGGTFVHIAGLQLRVELPGTMTDKAVRDGISGLQIVPRWQPPEPAQRRLGLLGSLRVDIELEQPESITLDINKISIYNARLGSMPLRGPGRVAGKGGRLRAELVFNVEGGEEAASCDPDELPAHVSTHGPGVYLTLEKLLIESSGFQFDEASRLVFEGLFAGSTGLLYALRALRTGLHALDKLYPVGRAIYDKSQELYDKVSTLVWNPFAVKPQAEAPAAARTSTSNGAAANHSASGAGWDEGSRGGGSQLVDDILRMIGKGQEEGNLNKPILTWATLEEGAPALTAFLSHSAERQRERDRKREMHRRSMQPKTPQHTDAPVDAPFLLRARSFVERAQERAQQMWKGVANNPGVAPTADARAAYSRRTLSSTKVLADGDMSAAAPPHPVRVASG